MSLQRHHASLRRAAIHHDDPEFGYRFITDELTVISMSNIVDRWRIAARGANT